MDIASKSFKRLDGFVTAIRRNGDNMKTATYIYIPAVLGLMTGSDWDFGFNFDIVTSAQL